MKEFARIVKFVLFSMSAGLIQLGSFTLMNELIKLPYWLSYLIALVLSVIWNFTFNRKFTFKSATNIPKAMLLVFLFYVVFTPASTWFEDYLTRLGWNEYLVTFINMFINLILEFLYQRFVVFNKSIDTLKNYKKLIHVQTEKSGHIQGIAIDEKRKYIYCSFTTEFAKFDMKGNKVASVKGLVGHLGCIAYNYEDGKVYGSLEFKHDMIGKSILNNFEGVDVKDGFYIASFDVEKMNALDMDAETSGIMNTVFLKEVTDDYSSGRFGTSGIDGTTFAPEIGKKDGKQYLYVAYGIYSDTGRDDNDCQVVLQYDISSWNEYARPLNQNNMHRCGPEKPDKKYFVYTGNTNFGIQNLEYDPSTGYMIAAVYRGQKEQFPNYKMYVFDCNKESYIGKMPDCDDECEYINLAEIGETDGKIYGFRFDYGSTGIAALGNGYFYISENKEDWEKKIFESDICLYTWDGVTPFVKKQK